MKTYKLYTILLSALAFASCNKEMTKGLEDVEVNVTLGENVTMEGQVVTVRKGQPVQFNISGAPDFVTFYSGELGHQYIYRNRVETDVKDIVTSKFKFNIYRDPNSSFWASNTGRYNNTIDVFYAFTDEATGHEGFPGLSKDDFDSDSTLVVDFYKNENWIRIEEHSAYDLENYTTVVKPKNVELDVKDYIGKNLVIAIAYNADQWKNPSVGGGNATNQIKYYFDSMCIENVLRNDTTTTQYAGGFMFTALNFNHEYLYAKSIKDKETNPNGNDWTGVSDYLPDNLAYGTVTANVPGLWNMSSVANGSFYIQGTGSGYDWKTSWLVSDPINILSCEPDQGESIKNLSQDISTYSYTYNKVGTYRATFLITNTNYKHDKSGLYEVVLNVIE